VSRSTKASQPSHPILGAHGTATTFPRAALARKARLTSFGAFDLIRRECVVSLRVARFVPRPGGSVVVLLFDNHPIWRLPEPNS